MMGTEAALSVGRPLAYREQPADGRRSAHIIIRRRQTMVVGLLIIAVLCSGLAGTLHLVALWVAAAVFIALCLGYVTITARLHHLAAERQIAQAFRRPVASDNWDRLYRELGDLTPAGVVELEEPAAGYDHREVSNLELSGYVVAYAVGWLLTPVVAVIHVFGRVQGGLDSHGVLGRVVALQQYGRSRSLRLLTIGVTVTAGATTVGSLTAAVGASPDPSPAQWAALRACESSGNYAINTGNGFYGAYQFSLQTWEGLGYSGLPSNASPAIQDQAAQRLFAKDGAAPWPVCGVDLSSSGGTSAPAPATTSTATLSDEPESASSAAAEAPTGSVSATGSTRSYTVQFGDTLSGLAARFGTTVSALASANGIANPNHIDAGQVLVIPS